MKRISLILALCVSAVCFGAVSPIGIFGGSPTMAQLPSAVSSGTGTLAFTSDQGLVISDGTTWTVASLVAPANTVLCNSTGGTTVAGTCTAGTGITISGGTISSSGGGAGTSLSNSSTFTKSGTSILAAQFPTLLQITMTGAPGATTNNANSYANYWNITDSMDNTGVGSNLGLAGALELNYSMGASTKAGRSPFLCQLSASANTADSGITDRNYVCGTFITTAHSQGGTANTVGNTFGQWYAINPSMIVPSGSTFNTVATASEFDFANASTTLDTLADVQIITTSAHTQQAVHGDYGLLFAGQTSIGGGGTGHKCGICFGGYQGFFNVATTGSIFSDWANANGNGLGLNVATVANILNFPNLTVTGKEINFPSFTVDGSGNTVANSISTPALTYGARVDVNNSSTTAAGTGYVPGDTITLAGGTSTTAAKVTLFETQSVSATVVAGGTGGTNGACTVTATTGVGVLAQYSGTVTANALSGALTKVTAGAYTTNPTTLTAEPVTGCGLTGATINIVMGALTPFMQNSGVYTVIPANPVAQASTTGTGTGATFTLTFGPIAAVLASQGLQGVNPATGGNLNVGFQSGNAITTAAESVCVGPYSCLQLTTGGFNTAIGHRALGLETTGTSNTAVGVDVMRNTNGQSNNTAVGYQAMKGATGLSTGSANTVMGAASMNSAAWTSGANNTIVGATAFQAVTSGSANTGLGNNVLQVDTTGANNTVIGFNAGNHIVSGGANTVVGQGAGVALNTSSQSVLIGGIAGAATDNGNIVAVGYNALHASTGAGNVCVGFNCGALLSTGTNTTGLGTAAVSTATANTGNTGMGFHALTVATGASNTAMGNGAGAAVAAGASNTLIGSAVGGATLTSGSNNILIGTSSAVDTIAAGTSNEINIGGLLFYNNTSTAVPVISACGTSPTVDTHANAKSGTVTVGSGTIATCTITFASAYGTWNHCRVTDQSSSAAFAYSYTLSAITVTATSLTSQKIDYDCDGV